ncbi:MAG: SagB family peptide dehydrogenase [Candidatus Binatia bacterium]
MCDVDKMKQPFVLSFKEGIGLHEQSYGGVWLQSFGARTPLPQFSPGLLSVLRTLSSDGATVEQLRGLAVQHDGEAALPKLLSYLQRFTQHGMLCYTAAWNGVKLATLAPTAPIFLEVPCEPDANARYVASRFAYLHKDGGQFVLESPLAHATLVMHDWRTVAFLHALAKPQSLEELGGKFPDIPHPIATMVVSLLMGCQALSCVADDGRVEEETPTLTQWEFHDLLFHVRSRIGRHANPLGATFRFLGAVEPLPALKPPTLGEKIRLYQPDIEALRDNDAPFTRVLEERQSIRKHGNLPMTATQLGEFLYRTARIRARSQTAHDPYERSNRPYPNGGACYELELYVVVNTCTGLTSGLYHYCPQTHQLSQVTDRTGNVEALLERAYYAADQQGMPQILLILTARFQRVAWKYEAMAYAVILKNIGVFYQTMYLVATAMGLAACALGNGDSDLFAAAAGTDYYMETSVGEFMLGSKAE